MNYINSIKYYIKNRIEIDTRSLAIFRILMGFMIIVEVLLRFRNLTFFYTDYGVTPRILMREEIPTQAFSFHFISGEPEIIAILFILQILFAIQLIIGYKTRWAIIICFIFMVSLDYRNTFITSYADTLFRLMLFWSIFLPLSEKYSIDSIRSKNIPKKSISSFASFIILIQIIMMYFINGLSKVNNHSRWIDGEAIISILNYEKITFFMADYVLLLPEYILHFGGVFWYLLLLFSGILIVSKNWYRFAFVLLFMFYHISLLLTVRIGLFSIIPIISLILFIQSDIYEYMNKFIKSYLANKLNNYLLNINNQIVKIEYYLQPKIYAQIKNKNNVIKYKKYTHNFIIILFTIILLISGTYMLIGNAQTINENINMNDNESNIVFQSEIEYTKDIIGINQPSWSFFTSPRLQDEYYIFAAETEDNKKIDILNKKDLSYDRIHDGNLHKQYDTYRHRFYINSLNNRLNHTKETDIEYHLTNYYCNNWKSDENYKLKRINLFYIIEYKSYDNISKPEEYNKVLIKFNSTGCNNNETKYIKSPSNIDEFENANQHIERLN